MPVTHFAFQSSASLHRADKHWGMGPGLAAPDSRSSDRDAVCLKRQVSIFDGGYDRAGGVCAYRIKGGIAPMTGPFAPIIKYRQNRVLAILVNAFYHGSGVGDVHRRVHWFDYRARAGRRGPKT